MKTSFDNSIAIKFKVDVEVSNAFVNELAKRLEISLFAGVGGFRDYPRYSNHLAGWPTIEQLSIQLIYSFPQILAVTYSIEVTKQKALN